MEPDERDRHLSQISTEWDMVFQAHQGAPEQVSAAQAELMDRYAGAVHRHLLAALRDPDAAAELGQEFALRFLQGGFHRADPARGRFRDFVKRALRNLMIDHRRRRRSRPPPWGEGGPEPAAPDPGLADFDRRFLQSWREDLMARAWVALLGLEVRTGQPYHTVLRLRVEHPELRSPELAERLSAELGRPITAGGLRQALQRSRDQYVGFLVEEVAGSLESPTADELELEQELGELGLLDQCRPALRRRGRPG
jgi:DNA-directed RNA polymerase specialized sigma24 family protein